MKKFILTVALAAAAVLNVAAQDTPRPLPAFFAPTQADFDACKVFPDDVPYPNWDFGEYYIRGEGDYLDVFRCFYDYNQSQDDWLILPQLATSAGGSFSISYAAYTTAKVSYAVAWGTEPTPASMTNIIIDEPDFDTNLDKVEVEKKFDLPAGQNVYRGFHVFTELGGGYLDLRGITVAAASTTAPEVPELAVAMDGITGEISVELPSKTVGGEPITSTLSGKVCIDGREDMTYTFTGEPGSSWSTEISVAAGVHTVTCTVSYQADGAEHVSDTVSESFVATLPSDFTLSLPLVYTPDADNYSWLTILDLNNDGIKWEVMDTYPNELHLKYDFKLQADDWAILPPVEVTKPGKYLLTMQAGVQSANCPESVELCLGRSADPATMTYTAIRVENLTTVRNDDGSLPVLQGEVDLPAAGKYYIGVHGFSKADQLTLYVSTITMDEAPKTYENIDPEQYAQLPADQFEIDVKIACMDGVKFTVTPVDKLMLYTNILVDESYLTEDGLDDLDFADQLINVSNQMLELVGGLEQAMQAEFFYLGDTETLSFGGMKPGTRAFLVVMGLEYDEATNKVTPATQVTRSEVFEFTDEMLPTGDPYAEFGTPEYIEVSGKPTVRVEVIPNDAAGDYVYGKVYPADYRATHTDLEIIDELTSTQNMFDTWLYPSRLDAQLAPGERALLAVTTLDKSSGKKSSKLNWMVVQAPAATGDAVIIISSASGMSGITSIEAADTDAEYYSLDGRRVSAENLTPGIYICRRGAHAVKVVVR